MYSALLGKATPQAVYQYAPFDGGFFPGKQSQL